MPDKKPTKSDSKAKGEKKENLKKSEDKSEKTKPKKSDEKPKEKKSKEEKLEFTSDEYRDLGIPSLPEAPKKKEKITIKSPGLSTDLIKTIKELEKPGIKVVLVNCERCKEVIAIPVPKKFVLKSELPVVPISFVHNNSDKDQHCITIHLDHDFDVRRQRLSDVIIS